MRFIGDTKIQFVAFRHKAYIISLALIIAGLVSLAIKGGPSLGIDFEGGTLVQLRFDKPVAISDLREVVLKSGFKNSKIQEFGQANEYLIKIQKTNEAEIASKKLLDALNAIQPDGNWQVVSVKEMVEGLKQGEEAGNLVVVSGDKIPPIGTLRDQLRAKGVGIAAATKETETSAAFNIPFMGLEAKAGERLKEAISDSYPDREITVRRTETVGPKIGEELKNRAWAAIIISLFGILVYISWRFEFRFAIGAIIALIHDILITLGLFSITNKELSLVVIAAFLTIVGYSLNDTIVVFDRIRENFKMRKKSSYESMVDISINESLSRTIITSLTTLMVVISLYFLGGEVIHDFAFALLVGIVVGTYSSIFVASPIIIEWQNRITKRGRAKA